MPHRLTAAAAALLLLPLARPAPAADGGPDRDPVAARMRADLLFLAGDECEGRGVETAGIKKAGEYIAEAFKTAGLKPAGADGSYFQPFPVPAGPSKLGTPNTLTLTGPDGDKLDLAYGADFTPLSGDGKKAAGLAFAGYGITAPDLKYDDYAGLDVKGKLVVVLRRSPRAAAKDKAKAFDPYAPLAKKVDTAADKGAAGVVFVNDSTYGADGDPFVAFRTVSGPAPDFPVFQVKRAVADKLLAARGKTLAEVEAGIDDDLKPRSAALPGWAAAAEVTVVRPTVPSRNVVAVAEGSGPLADETVVVGAHYDHVGRAEGTDATASLGGKAGRGKVHYGADDNASGTTGLIELARRFGAMKGRVGRRVVFAAFSGEERGLHGSKYYCQHPPFPLAKTVLMVNMDMIGRVVGVPADGAGEKVGAAAAAGPAGATGPGVRDRLVVYGTGTADGLDAAVDEANRRRGFKLLKVPGGSGPSDHESFYNKQVPVLFLFTGTHRDYHRPTDTPDKINVPGMKKVVDLGGDLVARYAAAARPAFRPTKGGWEDPTDDRPRPTKASGPRLGIMPGNYEDKDGGVLVEDVSPGGAAEKGGVKAKDVVVEIGGRPVKNIGDYMAAMAGRKAGQEVEVVVLRAGTRVTVKLVPQ